MTAGPDHLSRDEGTRKGADLISGQHIAMLTSIGGDRRPSSSTTPSASASCGTRR